MKKLFFLFIALLIMACSTERAMTDPVEHFSHVQNIYVPVFHKFSLEPYGIYRPMECLKKDAKYYVLDSQSDNVFTLINTITGKCVQGVNIGDGPDEVHLPSRFITEGEDVTIYDGINKKRYKIVENSDSTLNVQVYKEIGIDAIANPTFWGDKMVAKSWANNAWLVYYNGAKEIASVYFPSFPETDGLSDLEKMSVFRNGETAFNPQGTKIVTTINEGCVLAIYDCKGDSMEEVAMLKYFPPVFTSIKNDYQPLTISKECKVGFVDVCCSSDYIYALYSGKIYGDSIFTAFYGSYVFVYDWEGKPVRYYKLEVDLFSFGVDEEKGILYGIGNDPEGCILEYKL